MSATRFIRRLAGAVTVLILALTLGACAPTPSRPDAGVLRVGVTPNYAPIIFRDGSALVGLEADFARQLGADLGREIDFVELPWEGLLPALRNGQVDVIMSGMSITPARAQEVAFTRPYMRTGQMALVRREDAAVFGPPRALFELPARVGYERGTTGELFVTTRLRQSRGIGFDSPEQGLAALKAGQIDVLVHDAPTIWQLAGDDRKGELLGLFRPLTDEALAWAVRPDDRELRRTLDAALNDWSRSGVLESLINRWMRVRVQVD
jgi:ABC-type amino acid transport substrate-binding protein